MAGTDHGRVRVRLAAIDDRENPSVGIRPDLEIVFVDHGLDAEAQRFEIRLAFRTSRLVQFWGVDQDEANMIIRPISIRVEANHDRVAVDDPGYVRSDAKGVA